MGNSCKVKGQKSSQETGQGRQYSVRYSQPKLHNSATDAWHNGSPGDQAMSPLLCNVIGMLVSQDGTTKKREVGKVKRTESSNTFSYSFHRV
jgi:hypothetical protein